MGTELGLEIKNPQSPFVKAAALGLCGWDQCLFGSVPCYPTLLRKQCGLPSWFVGNGRKAMASSVLVLIF